ncbi:MAG: hypothetical protein HQK50_13290 [Oligoflexia bacterium]|nr:hypothetical protein [Oligoflexia bacterium]MBF0366541.1 hypothetical protein [Oligoflexia bacterium]
MSKVLVIESNAKLESIYTLNLRVFLDLEPVTKRAAQFAVKMLETESDISLVITRAKIAEEDTAMMIFNSLSKKQKKIPMIVVGNVTDLTLKQSSIVLKGGVDLKTLIRRCAQAINITAQIMASKEVPKYFTIPANYFLELTTSNCDVFREDVNDKGEKIYPKVLAAGEVFDAEKVKILISSGVVDFFVMRDKRLEFVNQVTNEMISKLTDKEIEEGDRVLVGKISMEVLSGKIGEIGITHETVALAKNAMNTIVTSVVETPDIKKLMKNLLDNKAGYLFQHTQILTYVVLHLVKNIDWGSKEHEEKLAFAAFFHDIVLREDAWARISSKEELVKANLDRTTAELVSNHARNAADLIQAYPNAPSGVELVVRQHHGTLNGIGFEESINLNLSPLTIAFMVAEEYTNQIIDAGSEKLNKVMVLGYLKRKFPTARFKKIIDILEKITI